MSDFDETAMMLHSIVCECLQKLVLQTVFFGRRTQTQLKNVVLFCSSRFLFAFLTAYEKSLFRASPRAEHITIVKSMDFFSLSSFALVLGSFCDCELSTFNAFVYLIYAEIKSNENPSVALCTYVAVREALSSASLCAVARCFFCCVCLRSPCIRLRIYSLSTAIQFPDSFVRSPVSELRKTQRLAFLFFVLVCILMWLIFSSPFSIHFFGSAFLRIEKMKRNSFSYKLF